MQEAAEAEVANSNPDADSNLNMGPSKVHTRMNEAAAEGRVRRPERESIPCSREEQEGEGEGQRSNNS